MCKWNLYFKAISQVFRVKTHSGQGWGPNAQQRTSWGVGAGSVCPSVGTLLLGWHPTSEDLPGNTGINTEAVRGWLPEPALSTARSPEQRQVCWGWDHLPSPGLWPRHAQSEPSGNRLCDCAHVPCASHLQWCSRETKDKRRGLVTAGEHLGRAPCFTILVLGSCVFFT